MRHIDNSMHHVRGRWRSRFHGLGVTALATFVAAIAVHWAWTVQLGLARDAASPRFITALSICVALVALTFAISTAWRAAEVSHGGHAKAQD